MVVQINMQTLMLLLLDFGVIYAATNLDEPMKLKLIRHQPCRWTSEAKWKDLIIFPNSTTSELLKTDRPGCYKIGGLVNVRETIRGPVQIHVELRYDTETREQCYDQKPNGCGGFGSCLYCDACKHANGKRKTIGTGDQSLKQGTKAFIYENGRKIDCKQGLKAGIHDNIYLHFCLPSKRAFLKNQGFDEATWDRLFNDKLDTDIVNKFGIFLVIRIYNSKVNTLMAKEHYREVRYRNDNDLLDDAIVPKEVRDTWPFTRMLNANEDFVSCHKVFGNILD